MDKFYNTTNFYLAVWLMVKGFNPDITYPENNNKATFIFNIGEAEAKKHIQEFYQDEIIQEFIENTKRLKGNLYANKEPSEF